MVDFGPPMVFPEICRAYTVEKMSLWQHCTDSLLEMVPLRGPNLPRGRMEGTLYNLTDEELHQLDSRRGVGVQCERKRMPVYVPSDEGLSVVFAEIYIGRKDYWLERVDYQQTVLRNGDRSLNLANRISDSNSLLHNRFCFLPPPLTVHPTGDSRAMSIACGNKNKQEIRRLRWDVIKKRFFSFLND